MLHRPDSQTHDIERCGSRAVVLRPLVGRARDSPCVSPAALRFVAVMPEPVARAGGASRWREPSRSGLCSLSSGLGGRSMTWRIARGARARAFWLKSGNATRFRDTCPLCSHPTAHARGPCPCTYSCTQSAGIMLPRDDPVRFGLAGYFPAS